MKISKLYGRRIEGGEGRADGTILGVDFDGRKICGILAADDEQREFYVAAADLVLKRNIGYIRAAKKPASFNGLKLGRAAYSEDGIFLGYMEDITADNLTLTKAKIGAKNYAFDCLILGDVIIVRGKHHAEIAAKDMFIDALCR